MVISSLPETRSPVRESRSLVFSGGVSSGSLEFAAQGAPDKLSEAQFLTPRVRGATFFGLSRQAERQRYTALRQLRSGHACKLYEYIIHIVKAEFPCCCVLFGTRSAACETRSPRPSRSPFLLPLTGRSRRWPIKSIAGTSRPRSGRYFTKRRG